MPFPKRPIQQATSLSGLQPVKEAVFVPDNSKITGWPPNHRSQELRMPPPFNRRMFVYNCRKSDGRTRTTTLAFTSSKYRSLMFLNREEFEALITVSPEIKLALIDFEKKL